MSKNRVCLADGYTFPTAMEETGINENKVVVGPTRGGKTFSIVEPMLLHTFEGSLVVNLTKRTLFDKYAEMFRQRGYEVIDLNFAEPTKSEAAYDPLKHIECEKDVSFIARAMVENIDKGRETPYWIESTSNALTALLELVRLNTIDTDKRPSMNDFYALFRTLTLNLNSSNKCTSNIDNIFEETDERFPDNIATQKWKTISVNSSRTSACISSMLNTVADDFLDSEYLQMTRNGKEISFKSLGRKKTVLFVTTSPVNKFSNKLLNIFYSDLFRRLFEYAESLPNKELPIPVHIICDDFATGGRIPDFAEYISIFCAKRISVTLLLQSETQLSSMYSRAEAITIINNCDTYVYMGGMDDMTCHNISKRVNLPVEDIYSLPLEQVIVFRRGSKPIVGRRYQTLEDPIYQSMFA